MGHQIFSATGCARCKIVKTFMDQADIPYEELDIQAAGKEAFKVFYRENRPRVFRGENGIEFPILFDGTLVFQGVGPILAHLIAGDDLDGAVGRSQLCREWISGFSLCTPGAPDQEAFLELLGFIKAQGLLIELEADGRHPALLEAVIKNGLATRLKFMLRGPARLYRAIIGSALDPADLEKSLSLLAGTDCQIFVPVADFSGQDGTSRYLAPEEAGEAAEMAARASGTKTLPFFIQPQAPDKESGLEPLESPAFFRYRTACRRHMVKADILK